MNPQIKLFLQRESDQILHCMIVSMRCELEYFCNFGCPEIIKKNVLTTVTDDHDKSHIMHKKRADF